MHTFHRIASFLSIAALSAFSACNTLPGHTPPGETLDERAKSVERTLAHVRDLPFKQDVPVAAQDKPTLKAYLETSMAKDWEKTGAMSERAWKQFGLIRPELDLKSWMADFMKDQIGGYYDTDTKRFYTIEDSKEKSHAKEGEETFVLAHELTHAIDDQYFDLGAIDEKLAYDDDRNLAFHSVCEGNAMDAGLDVVLDRVGFPASTAGPMLRGIVSMLSGFDLTAFSGVDVEIDEGKLDAMKKFTEAPPVIQAELGFPYLQGWAFTNRLRSEFGWGAVNAAFSDPPESSEQIVYPERYIDRLDRPQLIVLPPAPAGFHEMYQQTLGLMRTRVLLADDDGASSIDGWDGDRYVLWETPTGDALGWVTVWDSQSEAEDFEVAFRDVLALRFGPSGTYAVTRAGDRVAAAINVQDGAATAVAQSLLNAQITRQEGDEGPDRWYWRALRWPLAIRSLHKAFEFKVAGNWGVDWRSHADGFKFRLLNSLALHTENNPDRFAFWTLLGLVGVTSDRTVDYSYARIPLLFTWHGRDEGTERRARFGLALNSIRYENDREHKNFDLLWGLLFHAQWGERAENKGRLLFIPLWW